jgi:hypothetical protein
MIDATMITTTRVLKTALDASDTRFMQEVNDYLHELNVSFFLFVSADVRGVGSGAPTELTGLRIFRCVANPWTDINGDLVACRAADQLVLLRFERWRSPGHFDRLDVKHYDASGYFRGSPDGIRRVVRQRAELSSPIRDGIRHAWPRPPGATHYFGIDTQGVL